MKIIDVKKVIIVFSIDWKGLAELYEYLWDFPIFIDFDVGTEFSN